MRKIIQIAFSADKDGDNAMYAVCEDGTVWRWEWDRKEWKWAQMYEFNLIPEPEKEVEK